MTARRHLSVVGLCLVFGLALAGVGCSKKDGSPASQVVAKVGKEEISVHQINLVLQRRQGLKPEQTDAASKAILERLIDQQLAVQKAKELDLDRSPQVVQSIDAAQREIIARAYLDTVAGGAAKPTAEEIKDYYDRKPSLFSTRRVYELREIAIEASAEQLTRLKPKLDAIKKEKDLTELLASEGVRSSVSQFVKTAEQLPLNALDAISKLEVGSFLLKQDRSGVQALVLVGFREQPVTLQQASPVIEQFLWNEKKRAAIESNVKSLRSAADIKYLGKYAENATAVDGSAKVQLGESPPAASGAEQDQSNIVKGMGLK